MTLVRSRSRTLLAVSLLCAGTVSVQACVNDDPVEEDADGTGGSADTGGTSGSSGGSTSGTAECDNGANYDAHEAVQVTDRCLTANVPNCNITDFTAATYDTSSGEWGDEQSLTGGTFDYSDDDSSRSYDISGDAMNFTASVSASGYAGVGLSFGPCVDARDFDGIQITVGGVLAEGSIFDIQLQTDENYPLGADNDDKIGTCPVPEGEDPYDACQYNYFRTVGINPDEAITYYIPWAEFTNGKPNAINPQQLRGVQMQMGCDDAAAPCANELQIYDIRFYRDHDAFLGPEEGMGGAGN